jgi:membrane protein
VWPGALVAALAFEAAKTGFAAYIAHSGEYQVVYGSLGGLIALLFWVYVSANIMLFGAELAAELGHVMRGEPRHGHALADEGDWRHSLLTMLRGLVFAPEDERPPGT